MKSLLQRVIENPAFLSQYTQGMSMLYASGVFEALRENGRIGPVSPESPNYVEYQAAVANWSIGFNTALDQLLNFRELFLEVPEAGINPAMDFGGLDLAVEKGDLTKEEADAIRAGIKLSGAPTGFNSTDNT
jgi:hypothetical protein